MRSITLRATLCSLAAWMAASHYAPAARAQAFADDKNALVNYSSAGYGPVKSCADMGQYRDPQIVALHAEVVAAEGSVPAYCRISGTLAPEIAFEVSLPASWNGRFYMIGNGGHAGEALDDPFRTSQRSSALQAGFAFAQTNTGHDARKEAGASFVMSNPQKAIDYAYRAVHLTAITAKAMTSAYYAVPPAHSYWNSCSNGGRQGLIEAQRYPQDFDGIVASSPWVDQTGYTVGALWNQRALDAAPLSPQKLALLSAKVMEKCDAVDGLKDGLIDDPRRCDFDPRRDIKACPAGKDADDCLTAAQADTIRKIYSGPSNKSGRIFPGFMLGSESVVSAAGRSTPASAWSNFIVPATADGRAADFALAQDTMRYLVFSPPQPDYDYRRFDFDHDPHLLDAWGKVVDAKSTDLSEFSRRGGKLLMTYGWADQVLQPLAGVDYYESVVARSGSHTRDFFRLFMVPGMTHCSGGTGTDRFDPVTAVVNWVERGKAPDSLHAEHVEQGKVTRSRPLCPYPQVARYSGRGSIDEAANFSCKQPLSSAKRHQQ